MTKVALSGAGGQLGRFLRPALLAKGVDLRSAADRTQLERLNPQEEVMHGDLREPAVVDRLLQGADMLIFTSSNHAIGMHSVTPPSERA